MNKYSLTEIKEAFEALRITSTELNDFIIHDLIYEDDVAFYRFVIIFDYRICTLMISANIGNFNEQFEELDNEELGPNLVLAEANLVINNYIIPKLLAKDIDVETDVSVEIYDAHPKLNKLISKYNQIKKEFAQESADFFRIAQDGDDEVKNAVSTQILVDEMMVLEEEMIRCFAEINTYFIKDEYLAVLSAADDLPVNNVDRFN